MGILSSVSKQTKLFIIAGVSAIVVIILLMFIVIGNIGKRQVPDSVTLQFWGVFDGGDSFKEAIDSYEKLNRGVNILYKELTFEEYENQLIDSFAAGTGPDMWMMHNTWLPKHGDKIAALPQSIGGEPFFTIKDFQDQFVDVAVKDLIFNNQIGALPIYVDTLALYYNKDIFNTVGIAKPPASWEDFNEAVKKITVRDSKGNITRSGATIGTARNINRSTDILMLLMLQSGARMTDPSQSVATFATPVSGQNTGEVALQYYTDFANPVKSVYTWSDQQFYSIDAFITGKTAMMFNYSHHIPTIRDKAVRFNFGVAQMPQIAGTPVKVNFANYWAPTVAKSSKNINEAWKFLVFLSSKEGASSYLNETDRPPARRDLVQEQKNLPDIGIFAEQALSAKSWYQVDNTAIDDIFADMIDNINFGRSSVKESIRAAESQVTVLMRKARAVF